jgi:hypothetical protein
VRSKPWGPHAAFERIGRYPSLVRHGDVPAASFHLLQFVRGGCRDAAALPDCSRLRRHIATWIVSRFALPAPMSEAERRDLWEICQDRYQVRCTILIS